jgi:Arc/MetJ-type ribon-helix-helix transcriptional regulator
MPTSVRLDRKTEKLLDKLARERSQSKSEVIREAIEVLAQRAERAREQAFVDSIADLIGCVDGGPEDLSERTGKRFREILSRKETSD